MNQSCLIMPSPRNILPLTTLNSCTQSVFSATCKFILSNGYGKEFEVFAHSFLTTNKSQNLIAEKQGRNTVEIPLRSQTDQNVWVLVSGDVDQEFDEKSLVTGPTFSSVVAKLKSAIKGKGLYGLRKFSAELQKLDKDRSGLLELDTLSGALKNVVSTPFTPEELETIRSQLGQGGSNKIDYRLLVDSCHVTTILLQNLALTLT